MGDRRPKKGKGKATPSGHPSNKLFEELLRKPELPIAADPKPDAASTNRQSEEISSSSICNKLKELIRNKASFETMCDDLLDSNEYREAFFERKDSRIKGRQRGGNDANIFSHLLNVSNSDAKEWEGNVMADVLKWLLAGQKDENGPGKLARPPFFELLKEDTSRNSESQTAIHDALSKNNKIFVDAILNVALNPETEQQLWLVLGEIFCMPMPLVTDKNEGTNCLHHALHSQRDTLTIWRIIVLMDNYVQCSPEDFNKWNPFELQTSTNRRTPLHLVVEDALITSPTSAGNLKLRLEGKKDDTPYPDDSLRLVKLLMQKRRKALSKVDSNDLTPYRLRIDKLANDPTVRTAITQWRGHKLEKIKEEMKTRGETVIDFDNELSQLEKELAGEELLISDEFRKIVIEDPIAKEICSYCIKTFIDEDMIKACLYQSGEGEPISKIYA